MDQLLGAAVIGLGQQVDRGAGHGQKHARAYASNRRTRLIAVCDKREAAARKVADELNAPLATTDYREVLADPRVSVVSIVTPDGLHTEHAVAALEAGKHVLCEKPLALTVKDCDTIVAASRQADTLLMVGQVCRFVPGFVAARRLIEEGAIGDLFFVESEYAHHYEYHKGVDEWRLDPMRHPVIGGGCHPVDLLRWIAGDPVEAMAYANHKTLPDWPCDDSTVALLKFPKNVIGKVFVSIGSRRPYTMRSVFYGINGTIICDNTSPMLQLHRHGIEPEERFSELAVDVASHNVEAEISEFTDIILNDKVLTLDAVQGARTVVACAAIVESIRTSQPARIQYPW